MSNQDIGTGRAGSSGADLPPWARLALRGVPDAACGEFLELATPLRAGPGTVLFRAGDSPPVVLFVAQGTIRVDMPAGRGHVTLALLGPGDLVGHEAALDEDAPSARVTTVEPCELAAISRAVFGRALAQLPGLAVNVARTLSSRLRNADATICSLVSMKVDRRVARQLLAFARRYGVTEDGGAVRIPLRLTQQDLASLVGASRERTNRALVAFKRRGWIWVDRGYRVTIARPDLLEKRVSSRF